MNAHSGPLRKWAADAGAACYVVAMLEPPRKASVIAGQPLTPDETTVVERVLRMGGGYVFDFSDRTITKFFAESGVNIDEQKYRDGPSPGKANRVRSFLRQTPAPLVGEVMLRLLDYGIQMEFAARDDDSVRPTDSEVGAFRRLAARFGGAASARTPNPPPRPAPPPAWQAPASAAAFTPPAWTPPPLPAVNPSASGRRFRIALSFAGDTRRFVHDAACVLAGQFTRDRVLYDKFHEAEFARANLSTYLPNLYHKEADLVVVVACPKYDEKEWTGLEWRAIHNLIQQRRDGEVMLCRFERATVTGLYGGAGWVELDGRTPQEVAHLILERLALNEGGPRDTYTRALPLAPPPPPVIPPALPPDFDVNAEGVSAVPSPSALFAKLDFVPQLVNESPRWLRGVSAGLVFYADGEGPAVPRPMQAHIADRGSRVVRLHHPGRTAPNGASLPMYQDAALRVRHVPLHLANNPNLAPFDKRALKGGLGIQIPRPIGEPVLWRAALWVTAEGQPLTWFQVSVESGANNDPHPRPAGVERLPEGTAPVVGYQLHEYVPELGRKVWSPGRDPINPAGQSGS